MSGKRNNAKRLANHKELTKWVNELAEMHPFGSVAALKDYLGGSRRKKIEFIEKYQIKDKLGILTTAFQMFGRKA